VTAEHATMTCAEFLDAAAAVVLDAAEPDEVARVEAHAESCPDCAGLLDDFKRIAAALGASAPQADPPAELRGRVLHSVAREPRKLAIPRRLFPRAVGRPRISAAWLVAAVALLLSVGALAWAYTLQSQITALQNQAAAASDRAERLDNVVQVLASDRLAIRPLQPAVQSLSSRGMVYLDPSSGTGMLTCHNMPPLEQGHAYQVWFVRGSERISAGLVWPDRDGNGYTLIHVPADLQSFDSIGLTDEPGSGSAWPTTPRVIGTRLNPTDQ
jgi:anti-sigma-K factor RskA